MLATKPRLSAVFFHGAEGGSRTHMKLPSRDFESRASAIPPLRHENDCILTYFYAFDKCFEHIFLIQSD